MVQLACLASLLLSLLQPSSLTSPPRLEPEDGSPEILAPADDECHAAGAASAEPACALHALQRRGQKVLGGSHAQGVAGGADSGSTEESEAHSEAESGGRQRRHRWGHPPKALLKGISYGPMPCKDPDCHPEMDDFMGEASKQLWGPRGRGDLRAIRLLGANTVRLYGNSPTAEHSSFLDEAAAQGLRVVVGMSDYPYTQMRGACRHNGYDCYKLVKATYRMNLLKGFMESAAAPQNKSYHPALSTVIVINEPDLKMPGIHEPRRFAKAIVSALDGMLDAEKEVGLSGNLVNFTASFSFGLCPNCQSFSRNPGLGQIYELEQAMLHPEAYGYTPRNNLTTAYYARWTHSFNTAAPAKFVQSKFVEPYEEHFVSTPVVIMEYHTPFKNAYDDMHSILEVAENSSLLQGASFFEFQVRYDKGGSEMEFGMFGLGSYNFGDFDYYGETFGSWCLKPVKDRYGSMPALVAKAMGGPGLDWDFLCSPDPAKVPVTSEGYAQIASQGPERVAVFLARIVRHLGGTVHDISGLGTFSADLSVQSASNPTEAFGQLVGDLASPSGAASAWVRWDHAARCVADREANAAAVGSAVGWACSKATSFNCSDMPIMCKESVWATADWVFGKWYEGKGDMPLQNCYFGGSAVLAASDYPARSCGQECCTYTGSVPLGPTVAPTLPPAFGPEDSETTPPPPPPELVGDCHFQRAPGLKYYWDPNCEPHGGPGCNADGTHLKCRFCGRGPFPSCPTAPVKAAAAVAPTPSPGPSKEVAGDCSFPGAAPALPYFWDASCKPHGGPGCMADGKHMECRLCGKSPYPKCPPGR